MVDDDVAPLKTTCWVLPMRKVPIHVAIDPEILQLGLCLGWYGLTGTVFTAGEVVFTIFCGDYRCIGTQHERWRHIPDSNEPNFIKKNFFLIY